MATFKRDIAEFADQDYDVLIVGGGISGAWLALHCAKSGYRTGLIEKGDYASQTSSASSKLLHGGIRYLQQMHFGKVRESALERAHYLYAAPHLSVAVPFAVPTYKDLRRSKILLKCGMLAYRALCFGENRIIESTEQRLPPVKSVSADELNLICDLGDEPHTGAMVFFERHMINSERMVLAILKTAGHFGAHVINYVEAKNYLRNGQRVSGINAQDRLDGQQIELRAKLVINAAGPWIDNLNGLLAGGHKQPCITGFAIGSHIITRQISEHAIALTTRHQSNTKIDRGGRHVFIIPWRGYSLIGTSYDEIDNPNGDLSIQAGHVQQLLEAVNQSIPGANLSRHDLISGYSGLYPLQTENIVSSVYQGSGEYQIIDHASGDGIEGLVTALGAKFTTGRRLSERAMKLVAKKLGGHTDAQKVKLHNAEYTSLSAFTLQKAEQYADLLPARTIRHLVSHYGSDVDDFLVRINADPQLLEPINAAQDDILGQVVWAVEQEHAQTLEDVLLRRTSAGFLGLTENDMARVAELMATELGWSEDELRRQISCNIDRLQQTQNSLQAGWQSSASGPGPQT